MGYNKVGGIKGHTVAYNTETGAWISNQRSSPASLNGLHALVIKRFKHLAAVSPVDIASNVFKFLPSINHSIRLPLYNGATRLLSNNKDAILVLPSSSICGQVLNILASCCHDRSILVLTPSQETAQAFPMLLHTANTPVEILSTIFDVSGLSLPSVFLLPLDSMPSSANMLESNWRIGAPQFIQPEDDTVLTYITAKGISAKPDFQGWGATVTHWDIDAAVIAIINNPLPDG
ncbi:MAG: hypothetical protein M1834_001668 [Cirrosporium novae-zelandiae]|nr:MAG: hypothetical protein M1834_001668 [Cirrosporium novae-zelandiae]